MWVERRAVRAGSAPQGCEAVPLDGISVRQKEQWFRPAKTFSASVRRAKA